MCQKSPDLQGKRMWIFQQHHGPNLGGIYFRCIHGFSYLRYLIFFLHNQHLIPLSEYEPGLSQWRNETTWTLLRYQTSFSEYVYIYTITPQFQTQGFLHLFQRSSHPFEIPTHLVPTKRSPAKDSEITKPQSPLKLLGFSETDDQGWP